MFLELGNLCKNLHSKKTKFNLTIFANYSIRGVAQSGSAPGLGPGCRRFESFHPDHFTWVTQR